MPPQPAVMATGVPVVPARPVSEATPLKGPSDRFAASTKCNDWFFALLMIVHLLGVVVIAATTLPGLKLDSPPKGQQQVAEPPNLALGFVVTLVPSIITGFGCIVGLAYFMQRDARLLFNVMFGLSLALLCVDVAILALTGSVSGVLFAILAVVFILLHVLFWFAVQRYVYFVAACLETTLAFLKRHPATLGLGAASLVPALGWTILAALCIVAVSQQMEGASADAKGLLQAQYFFLIFSIFWVWQFVSSAVHVTVAGAFASWYFFGSRATNVVLGSLKRTFTSSFGSVSLGSLIVAVLQFLKFLVRSASQNEQNVCALCAECFLSCIEDLVKFFNKCTRGGGSNPPPPPPRDTITDQRRMPMPAGRPAAHWRAGGPASAQTPSATWPSTGRTFTGRAARSSPSSSTRGSPRSSTTTSPRSSSPCPSSSAPRSARSSPA